jgi:hypothetical protein
MGIRFFSRLGTVFHLYQNSLSVGRKARCCTEYRYIVFDAGPFSNYRFHRMEVVEK